MTRPDPATIADVVAYLALLAFALILWPPAGLVVTALAALAYSWRSSR